MLPEIEQFLVMINDLRKQVIDLIRDLPAEALNWRPVEESKGDHATNSLAVMAAHVAGAEHHWSAEFIAQDDPTRNRPEEFETVADSAEELVTRLEAVGKRTNEILPTLTEDVLAEIRPIRGMEINVRWGILHIIDHTALHLGHMQITYQLWAHGKSHPSPRWYERLGG